MPIEETYRIVLHMDRKITLSVQPSVVNLETGDIIPVVRTNYDNFQFFDIVLGSSLQVGVEYHIVLKFSAQTSQDGFYFHGYDEINQQECVFLSCLFFIT